MHSFRKFTRSFDLRRFHGRAHAATNTTEALRASGATNQNGPRRDLLDVMMRRSNTSSLKTIFRFLQSHTPREHFDEVIYNHTMEYERCQRYGLAYTPQLLPGKGNPARRRRIFFGSLIADDSWHAIGAHAAEVYGLYHTAVFIESNMTQTLTPRRMRFKAGSFNWEFLVSSGIFGSNTRVSMDYFDNRDRHLKELIRENVQRGLILKTWKLNGMTSEDIGIVSDVDEVFSRDFLLAAMTCDVPEFRPGQNCHKPKIVASSLVLESSPECIVDRRAWYHPDMAIGECIDTIGNATDREPALREYANKTLGRRTKGQFLKDWKDLPPRTRYPLWTPADFRCAEGGRQYPEKDPQSGQVLSHSGYNAFHMHNFFPDLTVLRNKYRTYGHPVWGADSKTLGQLHTDIKVAIMCAMNRTATKTERSLVRGGWAHLLSEGRRTPLLYANEEYGRLHLNELKDAIVVDESKHGETTFGPAVGSKRYRLPQGTAK